MSIPVNIESVILTNKYRQEYPFFSEEELKLKDTYRAFEPHLTEREVIKFNHEFNELQSQYEKLLKKYNDIVSERMSREVMQKDLNELLEKVNSEQLSLKDFVLKSMKYNLHTRELVEFIRKVR